MLVLVLILNLQQNKEEYWEKSSGKDLNREVAEFNHGMQDVNVIKTETQETRLRDMENTIKLVSTALSSQQKIIENVHGGDKKIGEELNNLKYKLHEIQQEYDTIISENYTLRARLKKIEQNKETSYIELGKSKGEPAEEIDKKESNKVLDVKIYDKPRTIKSSKPSYLDDTTEINSLKDTAEILIIDDTLNEQINSKNEHSKSSLDTNSKVENKETNQVTDENSKTYDKEDQKEVEKIVEEITYIKETPGNNHDTLDYHDTKKLIIGENAAEKTIPGGNADASTGNKFPENSILDNVSDKNSDDTSQEKKNLNKISDLYFLNDASATPLFEKKS